MRRARARWQGLVEIDAAVRRADQHRLSSEPRMVKREFSLRPALGMRDLLHPPLTLIELGPVRRKVRSIRLNVKYEQQDRHRQCQASAQHRPIRGGNLEVRKCEESEHHLVLSLA